MVAAGRGCIDFVEQLLTLGASLTIQASNNYTALDFATVMKRDSVVDLLNAYKYVCVVTAAFSYFFFTFFIIILIYN